MSRACAIIAVTLVLILGLEAGSRLYVAGETRAMCAQVYALEQAARREDVREARRCCGELTAHWVGVRARLYLLFEHEYVDRADGIIARLDPMIAMSGWDELLPSLTELTRVLESFPESLRISAPNLL